MDAALADDGVLLAVNRLSPLDRARVEPSIRYDTCGAQYSRTCCLVCIVVSPLTMHFAVPAPLLGTEQGTGTEPMSSVPDLSQRAHALQECRGWKGQECPV